MKPRWNLPDTLEKTFKTQIFSGGACNILNEKGMLLRNTERDTINDWLTEQGYVFFDPQIHPDTHDCEYDYKIHSKMEWKARKSAKIDLYEVSPRTFGGITSLEIAADHFRWHEPMVIYYSDGHEGQDIIPAHSDHGHPLFMPDSIRTNKAVMEAHYKEFRKNGNNMRKYLMSFAQEMDTLTVHFTDDPRKNDVVITPYRMHAVDMFKAIVKAASDQRVFVSFTGDEHRDEKGNPLFVLPEDPTEVHLQAFLDQYVDEGNELRRSIAELISISVFVRVVYTQKSAIQALYEVLHIGGIENVSKDW